MRIVVIFDGSDVADDLHRAMAEVGLEPAYLEGDPVDEHVLTLLQRSLVPMILAFGPGGSAHGD